MAHERILFEQVMRQRAAGRVEMQRLLMPLILQLTPEQQIDYARIADELHASGFETEPFGNRTIAVKAAREAFRGERGILFVTDQNMPDGVIVEGVVQRQRYTAWIAENAVHVFANQAFQ